MAGQDKSKEINKQTTAVFKKHGLVAKSLASLNQKEALEIVGNSEIVTSMSLEVLGNLIANHPDPLIIKTLLGKIKNNLVQADNFYSFALLHPQVSLVIAQDPAYRVHISPKRWSSLIREKGNKELVLYALKESGWKIADDLSAEALISLAESDKEITHAIVERFAVTGSCSWFKTSKLNLRHWRTIASQANEAVAQVLQSPIGKQFTATDLLHIARANHLAIPVILTSFSAKFNSEQITKIRALEVSDSLLGVKKESKGQPVTFSPASR